MSDKVLDWATANLSFRHSTGSENVFDCPFCSGESKLWYNDRNNVYICYRCGMSGNGVSLVAEQEDITYAAAKKLLGISDEDYVAPPMLLEELFAQFKEEAEHEAIEAAKPKHLEVPGLFWHGNHPGTHVDYAAESIGAMQARGFNVECIRGMRVGYFVGGKYNARTCLPVFIDGYFVYFQAWDQGKRFRKLKYLNPKNEEVGLGRSQFLYNYDRWANAETLVVTEGIFNAWAVEQAGYAAVAALGKSISMVQFSKLLAHPCSRLILGHDHDARHVSVETCKRLRGLGKDCLIARVPEGYDWNDLSLVQRQQVLAAASEPDWLFE